MSTRKDSNHMQNNLLRLLTLVIFSCALGCSAPVLAQAPPSTDASDLPSWTKDVGARTAPKSRREFPVVADGNGITNNTRTIQKAIDDCSRVGGGIVTFRP